MLVLTRHVHQSIVIGHDVVVTVLEVRGDQVRLGITAPKEIQVHREEVFVALTAANRQAATSAAELDVLKGLSGGAVPPAGAAVPAGAGAVQSDGVVSLSPDRQVPDGQEPDRQATAGDGGPATAVTRGQRVAPPPEPQRQPQH